MTALLPMQPSVPGSRHRLLIADDHKMVADGIRKLLEPEFEVVGVANDGRAAVEMFDRLRPDLTILDVGMPVLNGIEAARKIRSLVAGAPILFLSMHTDRAYVAAAFDAGAVGYLFKQGAAVELVEAVRTVLDGRRYVSGDIGAEEGSALDFLKSPTSTIGSRLTQRQTEVLRLIAEGKSMRGIAEVLGISARTVEFHKNGIMRELGLRSTAELTRYALVHGIA